MNYLKGDDRATMSAEVLNGLMNIVINGPEVNALEVETFTKEYLLKPGNRLCDPVAGARKHKIEDHYQNSNQASKKSKIFTN